MNETMTNDCFDFLKGKGLMRSRFVLDNNMSAQPDGTCLISGKVFDHTYDAEGVCFSFVLSSKNEMDMVRDLLQELDYTMA